MSASNTSEEAFWNEAQKRRNIAFMWIFGLVPLYPLFTELTKVVYEDVDLWFYMILLGFWAIVWCLCELRIRNLVCPKCGLQAFRHCWFFMKNAECFHCSYSYSEELQ